MAAEAPKRLRVEHQTEAVLGMDVLRPRFSWWVSDRRQGAMQSAYQVQVASEPGKFEEEDGWADVWDSGRVASSQSVLVEYAGPALRSRERCYWRVRTWDADGQASAWSEAAWFEMGLLERADWQGKWIGLKSAGDISESQPCPFLRRKFMVAQGARAGRLYVTAKGLYRVFLNGRAVSEDRLNPGWTDYAQRIQYRVYDVTGLLRAGENVLGAILGEGWYAGHVHHGFRVYGTTPMLLGQVEWVTGEGEEEKREAVGTDGEWEGRTGPILSSDMFMGERYDARLVLDKWCEVGGSAEGWRRVDAVEVVGSGGPRLVASPGPAVRVVQEIRPAKMTEPTPGVYIFDLGQNMVGHVRLRASGGAGTTVTIRHGEMLNPDGSLYTTNLRTARSVDQYTFGGDGEETYEPTFTFHGFRFVEVTGLASPPTVETVTGIVVHSAMEKTGSFECSDAMVNQLQSNIVWGQRGNFVDVPTDCPQRDERMGWTGDAQVFAATACFNYDVAGFFDKWLEDVSESQTPEGAFLNYCPAGIGSGPGAAAWGDAGVIVPWVVYLHYGDAGVLRRYYQGMTRWIAYMKERSRELIRPAEGFGDWLSMGEETPKDLIATAYFAYSTRLVAKIAGVLGKAEEAEQYEALFREIRGAFNREFVTPAGRVAGETQTGYVLALLFDLLPSLQREAALRQLLANLERRKWHLSTGFVGVRDLPGVLADAGRHDIAFRLLHNRTFPSWLYPITHGATTIWERWNGWTAEAGFGDPAMNSFNHYALGAVGQWLYARVGGIAPGADGPGFRHVVVAPRIDVTENEAITWARAELATPYGMVRVSWRREGLDYRLDVVVPANTAAEVHMPVPNAGRCRESGELVAQHGAIQRLTRADDHSVCHVGAGEYHFTVILPEAGGW